MYSQSYRCYFEESDFEESYSHSWAIVRRVINHTPCVFIRDALPNAGSLVYRDVDLIESIDI
jgi:hypothetical protein